jgi:hypothetical protein
MTVNNWLLETLKALMSVLILSSKALGWILSMMFSLVADYLEGMVMAAVDLFQDDFPAILADDGIGRFP